MRGRSRIAAGNRIVVAVATRGDAVEVPDQAVELPLPHRDAPMLRAEAARIDAALKTSHRRLAELAHLVPEMNGETDAPRTGSRIHPGAARAA
jgi:hypothetical protein